MMVRIPVALASAAVLASCAASLPGGGVEELTPIANPATYPQAARVSMPAPAPDTQSTAPNSLWRAGARSFFNDQRADAVGDILTVNIRISDSAQVNNTTSRSRTASQTAGISGFFGLEDTLGAGLPSGFDPENAIGLNSNGTANGTGQVNRAETISLTVAAVITDHLANGNFVIAGRQEVRVNNEVRELLVSGVIRPNDIAADNSIEHTQIAEARISYAGRGDISRVQRPRVGQRIVEGVAPF